MIYGHLGDYEKRSAAIQQNMRLDPGSGIGYGSLAGNYILFNRLDKAKATIREAQARRLDSPVLHVYRYQAQVSAGRLTQG